MTEDDIRNLFGTVGHIQSCKLIKDKLSQTSLGYAFVNYDNASDAEKAIESLNGLPMQSKTIKVSYARPSSAQIKNANLYVAYLPKAYTQLELEALFRPFGNIITSKVLIDGSTGLSRGVGFVRFDKHTEAETAIMTLNGKFLPGCTQPIMVKFANQPKSGGSQASNITNPIATPGVNAVRRTTPFNASGAGGPMRHTITNIRYNPVSTLTTAHPLAGLPAVPITPAATLTSSQAWCIFIYNLPENTEDSLLYQLFSPFGAISSVKVMKEQSTGKCKRYGFVNMLSYEEACQAIAGLNGFEIDGKPLQVSFKTAK